MTATKFGLAELEKYEAQVGFKKSDVRTIKGVCAIVDLPLTVVPEVEDMITACTKDAVNSEKRIADIQAKDAQNDAETNDKIAQLKSERAATKEKNKQAINASKGEAKGSNSEVARLQKLLKTFA